MDSDSGSDDECHLTRNVVNFTCSVNNPDSETDGSPEPGQLIFDANYESGNLGKVLSVSNYEYDIFIRPDTCNSKFRVWFNFTVSNVYKNQHVIFNIVNYSKTKSLYREGMSPVVYSTIRPNWVRLESNQVFYYRSPNYNKHYIMSFLFCFDNEKDKYQFAYCFPYTYSKLQNFINELDLQHLDYYKRELLALSTQQRRIDLLTITDKKNFSNQKNCKIVVVTARVHPGESPSSFVCQGLIEFLTSNNTEARLLRKNTIFKIIPMLNPDGVYLGNYRCCLMGFDLNRIWLNPSPWAHPTIAAAKNLLINLNKSQSTNVEFFIDIHAHSTLKNGFMYGNIFDDATRAQRQAILPKLLCNNAHDFSMFYTNFNRDEIKAGTSRRIFGGVLDEYAYCYTLEVSFYSYLEKLDDLKSSNESSHTSKLRLYTEKSYMELGRNVGKTFVDYYYSKKQPSSIFVEKNDN